MKMKHPHRIRELENFFREVALLTLNHETIDDNAVVFPSELGKALEKVDPVWWKCKPLGNDDETGT